ncbi:CPBP family glutamic-type intramembrane protease [Sharpea azabuensis]
MIFILIKNRWVSLVLSRILFSLAHTINLMTITPYLVISLFMEIAYGRYELSSATFIHMIYKVPDRKPTRPWAVG